MNLESLEYVFAVPGAHNIIDGVLPDGRGVYSGETLDEIRRRHPEAQRVSWADWQAERVREQDRAIEWTPVPREEYDEMLGVLPPACWTAGGFLVGEPDDHHVGSGRPRFRAYLARHGQYLRSSRPLTVAEYRALEDNR